MVFAWGKENCEKDLNIEEVRFEAANDFVVGPIWGFNSKTYLNLGIKAF